MDNIKIEGTETSPAVYFDFEANTYAMGGMSYMENVKEFFGPLLDSLETHLSGLDHAEVVFDFDMAYFNSSSARVIYSLFSLMDATAENGIAVSINWHFDEDDDAIEEQGEFFSNNLKHARFELKPAPA